jgi:hypothetical protein
LTRAPALRARNARRGEPRVRPRADHQDDSHPPVAFVL